MFSKLGCLLFGFLLLTSSTVTYSAAKVGDKFGSWSFKCQATAANKTACALSQTLVNKKTKRQVLRVVLNKPTGQEHQLLVLAPLGIYLPKGVMATIDNAARIPLTLKRCHQQGCMASGTINKQLLTKLKAGKNLDIKFAFSPKAKLVTLKASLMGISSGIKALN